MVCLLSEDSSRLKKKTAHFSGGGKGRAKKERREKREWYSAS